AHRRVPPPSTRSPCTTLFRSEVAAVQQRGVKHRRRRELGVLLDVVAEIALTHADRVDVAHVVEEDARVGGRVVLRRTAAGGVGEDRKSTRLNSSHVKPSYAVF